jgi:hypothetical protein
VLALFSDLPARYAKFSSAIFLPSATRCATFLEPVMPEWLPLGGLLLVAGEETDFGVKPTLINCSRGVRQANADSTRGWVLGPMSEC